LALRFKPLEGAKESDVHHVTISVSVEGKEPLKQEFRVKYIPPLVEPSQGKSKKKESPRNLSDLGIPDPILVTKAQWGEHDPPWTGEDVVKIEESDGTGKSADLKIFINMDSDNLTEYVRINRIANEKRRGIVNRLYEVGILIYSFVSYLELKEQFGDERYPIEEIVSTSMKGVSRTLLDLQIDDQMLKVIAND